MKHVHILHHSISPLEGQYPEGDPVLYDLGWPMRFARAQRKRYPQLEIECWRPERTVRETVVWENEDRIIHRVFPSKYLRYNLELSLSMLKAIRDEVQVGESCFFVHGSYNLHAYLLGPIFRTAPAILQSHGGFPRKRAVQLQ